MAALLIDINQGNEVIKLSYTFVSTANAIVLRRARIIFTDRRKDHPGIDGESIENLITTRTKAIVPVHYAEVACDMEKIMSLANKYDHFVIEDAAQEIFHTGERGQCFVRILRHFKNFFSHHYGHREETQFHSLGIDAKMNELQVTMCLAVLPYIDFIFLKKEMGV